MSTPMTLLGVPGTLKFRDKRYGENQRTRGKTNQPGTWGEQVWTSEPRKFKGEGASKGELIVAKVRFDDECFNGHNSFAVTGHTYVPGRRDWEMCGCIHEPIAEHFPELAHLIRWHLFDTTGPMHYVANTIYHASNLENGKAKGEPNSWEERIKFGTFPITFKVDGKFLAWLKAALLHRELTLKTNPHRKNFEVVAVPYVKKSGVHYDFDPHYSFDDFTDDWTYAPFKTQAEALEWQTALLTCDMEVVKVVTGYSKGKERNLAFARSSAAWPEATDEQLCLPADELKELLLARAPALLEEFKADVEATGLKWGGWVAEEKADDQPA